MREIRLFIVRRDNTSMLALQEARRLLGHPAQYQHCTEQEFNQLLSSSFAGDSGESTAGRGWSGRSPGFIKPC